MSDGRVLECGGVPPLFPQGACSRWLPSRCIAALFSLLLAALLPAQPAFQIADDIPKPERYGTGGSKPLSPDLQEILDRDADQFGLGLNTDWLNGAYLEHRPYIHALEKLGVAARKERIPGAVVYLDRAWGEVFPISVGCMMTDPLRVRNTYSTQYELGELTGAVTAVPMTLKAIERGDLRASQTLGELLPEVAGAGKSSISIEDLLRHTSGLPKSISLPHRITTREAAIRFLNDLPPSSPKGGRPSVSRYNFLLLGLILEEKYATPFQTLAEQEILGPFGMVNTTFAPPPHWRQTIAPGPYLDWLGRMAWAEPTDELTLAFGRSAASGGLVSSADDLGLFARHVFPGMTMDRAYLTTQTLELVRNTTDGKSRMGLGYELGRLGKGSIGFDAEEGCSIWISVERFAFLAYLSNANHPVAHARDTRDIRDTVFPLFEESLQPLPPPDGLTPPAAGTQEDGPSAAPP